MNALYSPTDGCCSFKGARIKTEARLRNRAVQRNSMVVTSEPNSKAFFRMCLTRTGETGAKPSCLFSRNINTKTQKIRGLGQLCIF